MPPFTLKLSQDLLTDILKSYTAFSFFTCMFFRVKFQFFLTILLLRDFLHTAMQLNISQRIARILEMISVELIELGP